MTQAILAILTMQLRPIQSMYSTCVTTQEKWHVYFNCSFPLSLSFFLPVFVTHQQTLLSHSRSRPSWISKLSFITFQLLMHSLIFMILPQGIWRIMNMCLLLIRSSSGFKKGFMFLWRWSLSKPAAHLPTVCHVYNFTLLFWH